MEAQAHPQHHHHEPMPTSGRALSAVSLSATLHCLTGCAIGEVLGMIIGTALGFSDVGTIALAVALAFLFGYGLTSLPLLRAGLALGAVIPIALASDTLSIATMEIVDNAIMLIVPGAMEAGVGDVLFWGALSVALVIAGAFAFPVNRWLIARGKGHVAVHNTGIHGGPPVKLVVAVAALAGVFGTTVLVAEGFSGDDGRGHGGHSAMRGEPAGGHQEAPQPVRGLAATSDGMTLTLERTELPRGRREELAFRIVGDDGRVVRDYEIEHTKRMHLIVVRRDLTGFQHLHPALGNDGTWRTPATLPDGGRYRVFADFKRAGKNQTLATDLAVPGTTDTRPLPPVATTATTDSGYLVEVNYPGAGPGDETELAFTISRDGTPIQTEPYLGAGGHLVALREHDLAYLHVHPNEAQDGGHGGGHDAGGEDAAIRFTTQFPSTAKHRLYLQFKHQRRVHTAAFTTQIER